MARVMKIINMKDTVILLLGKLTDYAMNVLMYSKKKEQIQYYKNAKNN